MTQHILFVAAGLKLAIRASQVKAVHEQLSVEEIAGTASWFLGLGVAHGRLLPVTDLGSFAGRRSCSGRILELDPSVAIAALKVDEVSGCSDVEPVDIPIDDDVVERTGMFRAFNGKLVKDKAGEHRLLDVHALVQLPAFINIKETNS